MRVPSSVPALNDADADGPVDAEADVEGCELGAVVPVGA
jgi:hypothetical protein